MELQRGVFMKKTSLMILVLVILMSLIGCSNMREIETLKSDNTNMKSELEQVKKENETLKKALDDIKFGAANLLKEIDASYNAKQYDKALSTINALLERHPNSDEASKAKEIKVSIDKIKEQEAKIREAEMKKKMEEEKRKLEQATSKMRKEVDDVRGITWYYDKSTTQYNNANSFHIYIGKEKSGSPWLRLRIQYFGDDWLFINNYKFLIDGYNYEITPEEVERDNNADVWEWYDTDININNLKIIKAIIESDKAILRCEGKQYYKDRTITSQEKKALQNVLDAYKALGGSI